MSSGSRARLPDREGSDTTTCNMAPDPLGGLRHATCPMTPDPASLWGGLRAATCPMVPYGLWASSMKKSLAGLPAQQGSPIPNACMHVSKAPDVRAITGLQDVWAGTINYACKTCKQAAIV
jgi:hypothetical protein